MLEVLGSQFEGMDVSPVEHAVVTRIMYLCVVLTVDSPDVPVEEPGQRVMGELVRTLMFESRLAGGVERAQLMRCKLMAMEERLRQYLIMPEPSPGVDGGNTKRGLEDDFIPAPTKDFR
jgi:hypothetical protein